jgi:hypothetical protein
MASMHLSKSTSEQTKFHAQAFQNFFLISLSLFKIFCYDTCVEVGKHRSAGIGLEMEVRISSFINVQRIMNMAPELQNN